MASLDSLPADQRAVLQLVLQRGRTYDDIAGMLSIDRAGVRERALSALDALGPQTGVPAERRALITDYLLGQLPARVAESTRDRLAESPAERAWARVIASELAPLAANPLPEIPVEAAPSAPVAADDIGVVAGRTGLGADDEDEEPLGRKPRRGLGRRRRAPASDAAPPPRETIPEPVDRADPPPTRPLIDGRKPSSRRGGAVLLIAGGLIVVLVVIIVIAAGGGSKKKNNTVASSSSTTATTSATTSVSTSASATPVAQIKLTSPTAGSKTAGVAIVVKQGTTTGIVITAQGVAPNTKHDAYAVWLYNSPTSSHILGFVNPGVGKNGKLQTAGGLPTNASQYKQLLVTLETQANPKQPGTIVLQGSLTGLS
jgi:hypothetical protein